MERSSHHDFYHRNISLQENQTGDSRNGPTVAHSEVANVSDEFPQDEHFEFDIDDLKDQLGIDHIVESLKALNEKLVGFWWYRFSSRIGITAAKSDTDDSVFYHDAVFDPTAVISTEQTSASTSGAHASTKQLDSSVFLPSVFEEKENFGSDVADVIAQRVNDASPGHNQNWVYSVDFYSNADHYSFRKYDDLSLKKKYA